MGPYINLGVELWNVDERLDYSLTEWGRLDDSRLGLTVTGESAQKWTALLDDKSNHVDASLLIVMTHTATLHGRPQVAGPLLLALVPFPIHDANVPSIT